MISKFDIIRLEKTKEGILGILRVDNLIYCSTLEHHTKCIPTGLYECKKRQSWAFTYSSTNLPDDIVWEVQDTKGRTDILIHWGNWEKDTTGCVLIGEKAGELSGKRAISNSLSTFKKFMHKTKDIDLLMLNIMEIY